MDEDSSADAFFADLLQAVEQQLASPATAYVSKTLKRLVKGGHSEDQAKESIAACLAEESDRMFRSKRPFDESSYRELLANLPDSPEPAEEE